MNQPLPQDIDWMRLALRLAARGFGRTSPNPMVGAVIVKGRNVIGQGWHKRAGEAHAEVEAVRDAQRRGHKTKGASLYVTLEPCSTYGRTPPCTDAILAAGIGRLVVGATDPNPLHRGRGLSLLQQGGLSVTAGVLEERCARLNEAFNHWIVNRTPFVTVKAAMSLDGKIATAQGDSKWITGEPARAHGMKLRLGADAILVGINTILADDPSLTWRSPARRRVMHPLRRIVLDTFARTPLNAKVVADDQRHLTTIVVSPAAPKTRVAALAKRVSVLIAPVSKYGRALSSAPTRPLDLAWVLERLGSESVTSLLVEGGGEVNASFLLQGLAQRLVFFYAPKVLGGRDSRVAVGGIGVTGLPEAIRLRQVEWRRVGDDLMLSARVN